MRSIVDSLSETKGTSRGWPRELVIMLMAAAALFSANVWTLSLPAIDDCFYARKGVEMARRGPTLTVTVNGEPNFQNPPLAFWILGACFRIFGENDLAARLPSIVMALGMLAAVWRIGTVVGGAGAGAAAAAMLLLTHGFANQARRCMLEIPLAFWVSLAMLVLVESRKRPSLLPLFAIPLAAAVLTKSVLGLLPLFLAVAVAIAIPDYRFLLRRASFWLAVTFGLLLGATWPIHQWVTFGADALRRHYLLEIADRAAARFDVRDVLFGYPKILLIHYQPVILPALWGAITLWRRRHLNAANAQAGVVVVWALLPLLLYSASSARAARYVYPTLPALALCAGVWMVQDLPRLARALSRGVAPAVAAAAAIVFWVRPGLLARSTTAIVKEDAILRQRVAPGEPLAYLGSQGNYWRIANPLLYYQERALDFPIESVAEALARARAGSGLLVVDRARLDELAQAAAAPMVLDGGPWVVLDVRDRGER